jgi:carbamoyltransferase
MKSRKAALILGINASHHGSACLLRGGRLVCAIQEERLSRCKRDRIYGASPSRAVQYCLDACGIGPGDLDMVVWSTPRPVNSAGQDIGANPQLQIGRFGTPVVYLSHHLGHAVSAIAMSGEREAAVLVVDGVGSPVEDLVPPHRTAIREAAGEETISLYTALDGVITPLEKYTTGGAKWFEPSGFGMPKFASLGGMYGAVAAQIFGHVSEAGKVMGLAPFGQVSIPPEDFYSVEDGLFRFSSTVPERFAFQGAWPLHQRLYADLARSVQNALEEALLLIVRRLSRLSGQKVLCYAGGVALNGTANERILREGGFNRVYIPAAAEDSGVAIGAAFYGHWLLAGYSAGSKVSSDQCGRPYGAWEVAAAIEEVPVVSVPTPAGSSIYRETARRLTAGQFGGWFEGGSELGPRALGQRSIVADPRRIETKAELNSRIKQREAFRPFAPAILEEHAPEWFDFEGTDPHSPLMLRVVAFKPEKAALVPAVSHVDNSGRLQTVSAGTAPSFYRLIAAFRDETGIPLLLNTSFNGPGEPIVETPADALWGMLACGLDFVVVEHRMIERKAGVFTLLDLTPTILADAATQDGELELLDAMNGIRNGHAILERLKQRGWEKRITAECLCVRMARLRAQNRICFKGW